MKKGRGVGLSLFFGEEWTTVFFFESVIMLAAKIPVQARDIMLYLKTINQIVDAGDGRNLSNKGRK
jgi:hypothetical protein